jgi:putative transport protein
MPEALHLLLSNPLIALFAIIGVGLLIGGVSCKDINLGSSGVLFAALAAGHLGYTLPAAVGNIGLVLFVYCVGVGAGGRFFGIIAREGGDLAKLALLVVASGAAVCWAGGALLDLPVGLVSGIFAGALTSTPALAAATEGLRDGGAGDVIVGYGIAYPFGVIGVVLFVQVLPRLLRIDLNKIAAETDQKSEQTTRLDNVLVEVSNTNILGQRISESGLANINGVTVSRVVRGERLEPLRYDDVFSAGQLLLLVGRARELDIAIDYIGQRSERRMIKDVENERQTLLVTSKKFAGRTLREIEALKHFGVVITRVTRLGLTFVPHGDTRVEANDSLTAVGKTEDLQRFAEAIGHRPQGFDETDLLSLSIGLTLGIVVGLVPIGLPGSGSITLGMAGGPLLVALVLGHFGRVGRIVGHIPRNTRLMLQELGLVLFLADAGVRGGAQLVATLQSHGLPIFLLGVAATIVPMLVGLFVARRFLKMNILQSLGGICGGMTSTPALGAITARTSSQQPVVSYASAYPVALIMMTVFAKLLIEALG